jgi:hypothetical protein
MSEIIHHRRFLRVRPNSHMSNVTKFAVRESRLSIVPVIDYAPGGHVWKFVERPSCRTGSSWSGQAQRKGAVWPGVKEGVPVLHFRGSPKRMKR